MRARQWVMMPSSVMEVMPSFHRRTLMPGSPLSVSMASDVSSATTTVIERWSGHGPVGVAAEGGRRR
jgi:hypothetical protein